MNKRVCESLGVFTLNDEVHPRNSECNLPLNNVKFTCIKNQFSGQLSAMVILFHLQNFFVIINITCMSKTNKQENVEKEEQEMYQRETQRLAKEQKFQELTRLRAKGIKKEIKKEKTQEQQLKEQKLERYKKAMDCKRPAQKVEQPLKREKITIIEDEEIPQTKIPKKSIQSHNPNKPGNPQSDLSSD